MRSAAFFRLEGALSPHPAWAGAMFVASSAPGIRKRVLGSAAIALSAALARRETGIRGLLWSQLSGLSEDRIAVLGADWANEHVLPSIRPDARRLVEEARAAGHALVLVSESIEAIARPVADALGFEHLVANALELDADGKAALREPVVGAELDPRRLRELCQKTGLDLGRSAAYGGSGADGILLSLVGLPCALDPDRELSRLARQLDWPIVHTRAEEIR